MADRADLYLIEKYHKYQNRFKEVWCDADTPKKQLDAYAAYVGSIEGILDGFEIGVKYSR